MSAKPAIRSEIDIDDIQALVWTGFYSLKGGSYMLLRVNEPGAARQWLRSLAPTSLGDLYGADGMKQTRDEVVHIAFTATGLKALDIHDAVLGPFSPEFVEGMTGSQNRLQRLGDIGANAPDEW